jgi:LacI family gluconate utilization system Gnt-I transcriptional repressor
MKNPDKPSHRRKRRSAEIDGLLLLDAAKGKEMSTREPEESPKRRRKTLSDVALRAGVSPVTVSRALRRPEMVSADLRRRVETAIQELAYIPNQLASALASSRTGTIGVLVPSLTNGVFADYLRALHDTFLPGGFQLLLLNSRYLPEEEERGIATLLSQNPEAIILAGVDQTDRSRRLLEDSGVPVIQTMELTDDPIDVNIGFSQIDAGKAATRHLLSLGHRRVGHIAARLDARARRRKEGYTNAMTEAGLDGHTMMATTTRASTVRLGAELFVEVLTKTPDLEAIFCCNDDLALGTLFECMRRGIRVPEDLSIIGFNDLEFCSSTFPTLTSVATPRHEMARRAAEIVLEIIRGSGERPAARRIDLGFTVNQRDSTRRNTSAGRKAPAFAALS